MTTTALQAPAPAGSALQVDPQALVISANVRSNVAIDKPFLASIRQHGVLVPISIWWDDVAGAWQVLDGQRRTLAAREIALTTVPAWVVPQVAAEDQRIVGQLTVNDHRKGLDDAEESAALHDLALFGMSADKIRRTTKLPAKRVQQALAVASNPTTAKLLNEQPVTLEQAAALADFADDPATFDRLATSAAAGRLNEWELERAREERNGRRLVLEKTAELEEAGVTVVHTFPGGTTALRIDWLETSDGEPVPEIDAQAAAVAWVAVGYGSEAVSVVYYVLDPAAHGWKSRYGSTGGVTAPKPTKEERKAARERAADWRTATTLRTDFLRAFLGNRIPTRLVEPITRILAQHLAARLPHRSYTAHSEVQTLLDLNPPEIKSYSRDADTFGYAAYIDQNPSRALNLAAAIVLADIEAALAASGYEHPENGHYPDVARYLQLTAALGHTLSPIEQHAAGITSETPAN